MATKRDSQTRPATQAVTAERAARLYRLLKLLDDGPQGRDALMRRLRVNMRTFYRDLEMLREVGVQLRLQDRRYHLPASFETAISHLPFPDPVFSLGDAIQLAKGKSAAHQRLKAQIDQIVGD